MEGKSEVEMAGQLKMEARGLLDQLCIVMNKARAQGMILNWNISPNPLGMAEVQTVTVMKPL